MTIINQKKVILVNGETSTRNPDCSTVIYLTADKVAQCILVSYNRREKVEAKKGNNKEDSQPKVASSTKSMWSFSKFARLY